MGKKAKPRTRRDYYHDTDAPKPTSRQPSASAVVRDRDGRVLMLRRVDNGLWTIPTGRLKMNETISQCAIRECLEETGIEIEVTGLVGVFSDPVHVIAYYRGENLHEVRQPVNVCLHARPTGGNLTSSHDEASEVHWFGSDALNTLDIHRAIRRRVTHALTDGVQPLVD